MPARDQAGRAVIRQTLTSHLQARQVLGNRELAARFCTGVIRASRNVRKKAIWRLECPYVAQPLFLGTLLNPATTTKQDKRDQTRRNDTQLPRHAAGHARRRPDTDRRRDRLCHLATPLRRTRRRRSDREPPPVLRAVVNQHQVPGQDPRRRARANGGAQSHVRRHARPVQELASRPAPFLLAADPRTALLVVVTKREFELRAPRGHGAPEARACRTNLGDHVNKVRFVFLCWHDIGYCSLANPRPAALLDRTPGLAQAPFAMVKRRVTAELRPHVPMLRLVWLNTAYYDRVSTARRGRAQEGKPALNSPVCQSSPCLLTRSGVAEPSETKMSKTKTSRMRLLGLGLLSHLCLSLQWMQPFPSC